MPTKEGGETPQAVDLVEDLNSRLREAEATCDQYQSQLAILQERLDKALRSQAEKEEVSERLRLELQESRTKCTEIVKTTGQRIKELEETSTGLRASNAKLTDDKEYYNNSMETKALSGPGPIQSSSDGVSPEIQSLKSQNTALALYVNNIITRLLQHESFEDLFSRGSTDSDHQINTMAELQKVDTALKALSNPEHGVDTENIAAKESDNHPQQPSLLKRAGSIFSAKTRSRPSSVPGDEERNHQTTTPPATDTSVLEAPADAILTSRPPTHPNEDPATAMSIPLRRADSRRRPGVPSSEWRGPPSSSSRQSSGQVSPGIAVPRRTSYFGAGTPVGSLPKDAGMTSAAVVEAGRLQHSSRSTSDSGYGEVSLSTPSHQQPPGTIDENTPTTQNPSSSSPASSVSSDAKPTGTVFNSGSTSAAPNRMRPLRLVQEKQEADDAALAERKKANRSSWMGGWFAGGAAGAKHDGTVVPAGSGVTASQRTGTQVQTQPQWPGAKPEAAGGVAAVGGSPKKLRVASGAQ